MNITPNWTAPSHIKAISTTRLGGVSIAPFDQFNLATHVNDDPQHVQKNRALLYKLAKLPQHPRWLNQTHSNTVIHSLDWQRDIEADACFSDEPYHVCVVMTADCLPILLCDQKGQQVAAIHAGWRGLASEIIQHSLQKFTVPYTEIIAWLGPAIGPQQFNVGFDVFDSFISQNKKNESAFKRQDNDRFLADIYQLAKLQLNRLGIKKIIGGDHCTVNEKDQFFSYRRDGTTGRMATMIWIDDK